MLFLNSKNKLHTAEDIDKLISAEIPDPETEKDLYEVVKDCMLHGPCGPSYKSAACMIDGKCSK